ncbi:hypothetical protein NSA28_04415 [Clostridium perfringens]|uniref:hypothetical protein n=1 Tax=Clostridium perfringens TaxID=1502 RepID=UPI0018D6FBD7|nr:hypothetical protein [Clostridium perfringens]MCR1962859.1 hypothetical protein [Clostridium perfringens]QPR51708.1 hypothetical protein I6G88_01520 [Clostridium perfringens]
MLASFVAYVIENYGPIKGKKAFQKIFYFLTEKGIPTNLKYSLYHYGPYSAELDVQSNYFETIGAISIFKEGTGYLIEDGIFTEVYATSKEISMYTKKIDEIVKILPIQNPMKLELYSTIHYINNVIKEIYENNDIIELVSEVKNIKKDKFSEEDIIEAYEYLNKVKLIN